MKQYRTGFVVGKFCPLTRGHQYLIDTAVSQCENLIILSYTSQDFESCSPAERERWLKVLYPSARVHVLHHDPRDGESWFPPDEAHEATHRKFCAAFLLQKLETTVQAVFTSETYGDGLAAHLQLYFSEMLRCHVPVTHICVDPDRETVPISGTAIRRMRWVDAEESWKQNLSPIVRASFVPRIAILGGESTGKTTLCARLSNQLSMRWVPEFGRSYTKLIGGVQNLVYEDLEFIGRTQIEHELESAKHVRIGDLLFCDTTPLTTEFYSGVLFDQVSSNLQTFANREYARVYLCDDDIPHEHDGTRFDPAFRERGHLWYIREFGYRNIEHVLLSGTIEDRCNQVIQDLREQGLLK